MDMHRIELAGGMRLTAWCKAIGISQRTAVRWRDAGKLKVVDRYGMQFVTAETIKQFFEGDGQRHVRGIAAIKAAARQQRAAAALA
jgi:predicted site-specific integrase-resolvase